MLTVNSVKEFLKPKRNKISILLIFIILIVIYLFSFVVDCSYRGLMGNYQCSIRSKFDGKSCTRASDCGGVSTCILRNLEDKNKTIINGVCKDDLTGCHIRILENGNLDGEECYD